MPPFEPLKLKKMPQCLLDQLLFSHLDPTRGQFNNAKQIDHPPQTVNVSGQAGWANVAFYKRFFCSFTAKRC